jgi:hypothetical protein
VCFDLSALLRMLDVTLLIVYNRGSLLLATLDS